MNVWIYFSRTFAHDVTLRCVLFIITVTRALFNQNLTTITLFMLYTDRRIMSLYRDANNSISVAICFDRCCYYLPVLLTAGLILTEKKEGMMERMMVSGEYTQICYILYIK